MARSRAVVALGFYIKSDLGRVSSCIALDADMLIPEDLVINTCIIRAAQTGVFDLDIRISNPPFIDVCNSVAAETGLKSRNVEKRINAV
jgi:hypothetical protein